MRVRFSLSTVAAMLAVLTWLLPSLAAQSETALVVRDFITLPVTGSFSADGNPGSLARVSMMREEPGGTQRLFINDLNGPFYIFDRKTGSLTTYLDFNGRDGKTGLFARLPYAAGYQNGFMTFAFDPDYPRNGIFYTLHMEEPGAPGAATPDNTSLPGLRLAGYTPTPAIRTPGEVQRESVLIEWTDTNVANTTFEGTAREILRIAFNTRIHPCGDLVFNPTARPGDADWRALYIACGDGGAGEQKGEIRQHPQRLDTLVGKILRIVPDLSLHKETTTMSENGRYRIPRDNPFAGVAGARPEIWAYGLRNPHRLAWAVDPATGANHLIAASIGLNSWEAVYIVHKGANYGYPAREGTQLLQADNRTAPLPTPDEIPVQVSDTRKNGSIVPTYPVAQYGHLPEGGDAISGGFVYRGTKLRSLVGKYVFGDITTGRIWFADLKEMLAADDANPATLARTQPLRVRWDDPADSPDRGPQLFPTMFPVVLAGYKARGGKDPDLPGRSTVSGPGRADIRFAVDAAGELYLLSKADGIIRAVTTALPAGN
ncbi:MAG TPA: PQQ-dependent sugar dehydrogenase [Vicinamibacterales bacterium]|nr:PQQ-dependent sugar dehydrogenase [Vicinamibacterales bacterium]